MFILFRFEAKLKNRKQNEAKQKNFGSETKRKYAVLISLQSEAKRTEKKNYHVSVRNACKTDLVSLRFALKQYIFFAETGAAYQGHLKVLLVH
jgi:hypothetical protein